MSNIVQVSTPKIIVREYVNQVENREDYVLI